MHTLYFVIFDKEDAFDSREAGEVANDILIEENFCYQDGFFSAGKADWFNVGGSSSGILQLLGLGIDAERFFDISEDEKKSCWAEKGGVGPCPWAGRNMFERNEDDAMIVTESFYQKLVNAYPDVEVYDVNAREEYMVKNLKSRDIVNRWIVVVDYHS